MIEATGPGVVIAGKTCAGKGIFITQGADITIRGITFADASVIWHNGAGIRAAGDNLTVEHSRFLDNENGILAGGSPNSVLRITDSEFIGNGACIAACAHGVYAGAPIAPAGHRAQRLPATPRSATTSSRGPATPSSATAGSRTAPTAPPAT